MKFNKQTFTISFYSYINYDYDSWLHRKDNSDDR